MKKILKSKNWLIIFIIGFAIFAASAGFFIFKFNKNIDIVRAGTGENVSGFAWNSNIGWISFNTIDCDTNENDLYDAGDTGPAGCPAVGTPFFNYGVNINPTTGNFSGYAWSNNVGWISFVETDLSDYAFSAHCDDPATCDETGDNCTACYNSTDNNVYGWAKILSLGDEGWIKMGDSIIRDTAFPISFPVSFPIIFGSSFSYGVSIDAITNDFSGWAWNGNGTGAGIGWVNFNCADEGVCAADGGYDYKVYVSSTPPNKPAITSITPLANYQCERLVVAWGDVSGETGYRVYRDTVQVSSDLSADVTSFTDSGLAAGTTYDYVVQAFNLFGSSDSDVYSRATYSVCAVSGVTGIGKCPNIIELDWGDDVGAVHYEVQRCKSTNPTVDCSLVANYSDITGGSCVNPTEINCVDDTILGTEVQDYFQYRVRRAVSAVPEHGDWSAPSDQIQACPGMPTWKEVK
ncbi:fibronectin type III domain-containing protein [Candidatus Parcubacteria bacterium]|nr:fibronectin type III domain-containing protein [Candidatus Parcubacteria bacterium]